MGIICAIWGPEKSWKSTFALTFPKPIVHFDIDVGGYKRASWRVDTTDVVSESYPTPIQVEKLMGAKQEGATVRFPRQVIGYKAVWQKIVVDFVDCCQSPKVQTIIMDSATELWRICHTSLLQEKQEIQMSHGMSVTDSLFREKLKPVEYPNERMRSLIYTARSHKKNLVLTHYPRDVYGQKVTDKGIEDYKTGAVEPDGFKDTQKLVDIVIWIDVDGKGVVSAKITKCGLEGLGTAAVGLPVEPSYQGILNLRDTLSGEEESSD